ncbi:hypothetical protein Fmac_011900 [Flemingia macrophylla]|uniref:Uncharacterized protein n=1 Tax=Flemingia macrophylla TaxID=520843 RepID=A0ABD1MNR4_9FABA
MKFLPCYCLEGEEKEEIPISRSTVDDGMTSFTSGVILPASTMKSGDTGGDSDHLDLEASVVKEPDDDRSVLSILCGFCVRIDNRIISIYSAFVHELNRIMGRYKPNLDADLRGLG